MPRFTRPSFDPSRPLIVRRGFKGSGRTYRPGDGFDWRKHGVAPRRVRQLYDAGNVAHADDEREVARVSVAGAAEPQPAPDQGGTMGEAETPHSHDVSVSLEDLTIRQLREMAEDLGAPTKRSREDQIEAIRAAQGEA